MSNDTTTALNGVDVDQLTETISAIEDDPDLARFEFRARTEWLEGAQARTTIQRFYGAGQEDDSREEPFVLEGDEPPVLLGSNQAPNAVETVLHALASCLAVGYAYNAAAKDITLDALELEMTGELDLQGFLGLNEEVRPGYDNIRVRARIKADAPRETLEELCAYTQKTSPVMDMLRNAVPVEVEIEA
ncbi:MAG: OsmC family protein [Gemmatimonadota bacterium]